MNKKPHKFTSNLIIAIALLGFSASLNATDIENHSEYSGEAFGIGIGANFNGQNTNITPNGIGYGHDSDSQYSTTNAGINTANIIITNKEQQQALTGKSVEETIAAVKTDVTTDNYAENSGSLNNNFDADRVQSEIDLQREVTQEFAPLISQGIANVSEWLGNTSDYQNVQIARDYLQTELSQTTDPQRQAELSQALNTVDNYLADNQTRYQLFQEGGIGRTLLHTIGGGILTGDISGAVGAGTTSLAAPVIAKVADNSGSLKPVVDTVGGLAIGYATGGTAGAFTGANADWNNRQLHPSEYKKAEEYAEIVAKHLGISRDEALGRIVRHMLRTVDYETAKADDFRIDQAIISLIGANNLPKRDEHYYDTHYNEQYISTYANDFNLGRQNAHSGKTPAEIKAYNKGVVTDIPKAFGNAMVGVYESAANFVTGEIFPESAGYVRIGRPFEYTHDEYGNALENTMTLGVAAVTAGRGVKSGGSKAATNTATANSSKIVIHNPVLDNIRTGSALKADELHAFNNIIDNYAGQATRFNLRGGDGVERSLYQIEGSLNGKNGVFEWIVDPNPAKGVVHRRFIENVRITGKPNATPKKGK